MLFDVVDGTRYLFVGDVDIVDPVVDIDIIYIR
jgi:hypothetical protein